MLRLWLVFEIQRAEHVMKRKWEYCTMVATHTIENRVLVVSILKANSEPESRPVRTTQLGAAIAQLGADGWEMCGFYTINLSDGLGQQFYFKRPMD
jgi:hypothetical protein